MRPRTPWDFAVWGEKYLTSKGVEEARISSERLLEKALGHGRMSLFLEQGLRLGFQESSRFFDLLRKRSEFYPLQYLTGEAAFRELVLEVREGVLIPRPETELLVDELHRIFSSESTFRILDIGTGTGNIALAAAQEFPNAEVWAVDVSLEALELSRINAAKNGLGDRVNFLKSDLMRELGTRIFDVIVSNPPYIPEGEREGLQKEVRFEPETALFAGRTGLQVIERILKETRTHLTPRGHMILEIGAGQHEAVSEIACENGFKTVAIKKDYSGIERILTFQRNEEK